MPTAPGNFRLECRSAADFCGFDAHVLQICRQRCAGLALKQAREIAELR